MINLLICNKYNALVTCRRTLLMKLTLHFNYMNNRNNIDNYIQPGTSTICNCSQFLVDFVECSVLCSISIINQSAVHYSPAILHLHLLMHPFWQLHEMSSWQTFNASGGVVQLSLYILSRGGSWISKWVFLFFTH